ncbi:MAG: DUF4367 domain-containing protein [Ruminococcaceae bacterium]|nr:DUF4367 domain-containing protein [Oscillospiraceae bacterium]
MREIKTCPNQEWQQMPTEALDQILQAELQKEHPNEEVVLSILRELEEREKDIPVERTPEILEIRNKLNKHDTSSKQSIQKRRWLAGIAAAAAVIILVIMISSPTAQAESLLDILFRWTNSIFEFIDPNKNYPNTEDDFVTDNPGLQQLYDKVTELGVTESVVPMWLPEGFELSDLKERPIPRGNSVHSNFKNGDNDISITYRISTDISSQIEKEEAGVELFEFRKIGHFIVENEGALSVTWTVDGVKCVINTNVSKDDIYTIIKSIYRSELTQ